MESKKQSSIQISNVNTVHWLMVSTVGAPPIYDSKHGDLREITKSWLLIVEQPNGNDCGAFTADFALSLCFDRYSQL